MTSSVRLSRRYGATGIRRGGYRPYVTIASGLAAVLALCPSLASTSFVGTQTVALTASSPSTLDRSGNSVPDTNYPIPAGALFVSTSGKDTNSGSISSPLRSITKAINAVRTGGTVVVRGGTYRDGYRSSDGTTYGIQNK